MKYFKPKFIFLLCLWWWGWGLILFLSSSGNFGENKIVFCPVGQGDATILLTKGAVMLVDGGPDENMVERPLAEGMPLLIDQALKKPKPRS